MAGLDSPVFLSVSGTWLFDLYPEDVASKLTASHAIQIAHGVESHF